MRIQVFCKDVSNLWLYHVRGHETGLEWMMLGYLNVGDEPVGDAETDITSSARSRVVGTYLPEPS